MSFESTRAFIGIGSNLCGPVAHVRSAIKEIDGVPDTHLERSSSLYSSPPMGPPDQPDYVNAVVEVRTSLDGLSLLDQLQHLERTHGRLESPFRWGPRTLDLDILLFGAEVIECDKLSIPHPGLSTRAFVVIPLAEIAPDLRLPGGVSVADLAGRMPHGAATRLPDE